MGNTHIFLGTCSVLITAVVESVQTNDLDKKNEDKGNTTIHCLHRNTINLRSWKAAFFPPQATFQICYWTATEQRLQPKTGKLERAQTTSFSLRGSNFTTVENTFDQENVESEKSAYVVCPPQNPGIASSTSTCDPKIILYASLLSHSPLLNIRQKVPPNFALKIALEVRIGRYAHADHTLFLLAFNKVFFSMWRESQNNTTFGAYENFEQCVR